MLKRPVISCVIPVYNGKHELRRAVDSVLAQVVDVQVILVDDASTDGSAETIVDMAAADPRIVALTMPINRGQGFARNVGVAAADARYVTFLDQDDEHLPGWYAQALEVLEGNPGVAAVKGDIELIGIPANVTLVRGDVRWRETVYSVVWNVVMRKAVYGVLGGSPAGAGFRTREGKEDIPLVTSLVRNFRVLPSACVAARHYIKPGGATAYYLARTTVVDDRVQFLELTEEERTGLHARSVDEYHTRSNESVESVRAMLQPRPKGLRVGLAELSARMLQRFAG
jgi:glycosyltransferase involved in cell wall biosynthesis